MAPVDGHDDEETLKAAVKDAQERLAKSKTRAQRLTDAMLLQNKRQREFLDSVRQANEALGG